MPDSNNNVVHAFRIADAEQAVRHVFIRDLTLTGLIGVYSHEKSNAQRIRINVDLAVKETPGIAKDCIVDVVSYEDVANGIRNMFGSKHVNLVETLAENISDMCFSDKRVLSARVRIEKLEL